MRDTSSSSSRPDREQMVNLIVRVTPRAKAEIAECAADADQGVSDWVRSALRAAVRADRRRQARERGQG